jgi:hypothetical protein
MSWDESGDLSRLNVVEFAGLVRVEGVPEVNGLLEIQPELGLGAGESSETKSGVRRYRSLSLHNLVHARVRNPESLSGVLLCDAKRDQEILEEDLAGVCGPAVLW